MIFSQHILLYSKTINNKIYLHFFAAMFAIFAQYIQSVTEMLTSMLRIYKKRNRKIMYLFFFHTHLGTHIISQN